ncbi:Transcriptional regulator, RpiR family [Devosia sp. LC5]|uniref:MurR/RpiR family transcriptional regulator n=1 Tax=Devosia sp. LC5 TaxID=1502724 RepID=UPI0004E3DD12|nr:MurR/RpiR family transcriptional regulator [Devosia sp. LC5]KFC61741.1 Transcriptional regulator, RpiR family [Devosia sp. LC5]
MRTKNRLPAQTLVAQRIATHYSDLSSALRQFADQVLADPVTLARMSIHEAVETVGVSVATANRFATAIGFAGYAEFRSELIKGFESLFAPAERLKQKLAEGASPQEVMIASMREDIANLEATISNLTASQTEKAVEMIVNAERIYIAGFENAGSLANILAVGLELTGKSVRTAENGGGVVGAGRQLFKFGENDLVIAVAFAFYMRDTLVVTQHARQHGIPVLAITDHLNSPLAAMSALSLLVEAHHEFNPPSDTAILGLIEALVAAVASKTPNAAEVVEKFAAYTYPWMISSPTDWVPD